MTENKVWVNEESALKKAAEFYGELPVLEKQRHNLPLQCLKLEEHFFREAMVLQIAGFALIAGHQPFRDKGTYAASVLAISIFDHLRQGWVCILEGYYVVAQTLLRRIFEGTIYEMTVVLDPNVAADWWRDKLGPGTVTRKLIPLIEKEFNKHKVGSGTTLAQRYRDTWKVLSAFTHSNWRAISTSAVSMPTQKGGSIPVFTFGGNIWKTELCQFLGKLYARSAIEATVAMGLAFAPELVDAKEWYKRQADLITEGLVKDLKLDIGNFT